MKILIACYSWKGHTRTVAQALAKKLDASRIDIEPQGGMSPVSGGIKALFGLKGKIRSAGSDIKEFDHLVIATPVWSHNIPPYTRQYLSEITNSPGKKFSVLVEMGGSGAERVVTIVRKVMEAKGMEFVASAVTLEKDVDANQFDTILTEFAEKIQSSQKNH